MVEIKGVNVCEGDIVLVRTKVKKYYNIFGKLINIYCVGIIDKINEKKIYLKPDTFYEEICYHFKINKIESIEILKRKEDIEIEFN